MAANKGFPGSVIKYIIKCTWVKFEPRRRMKFCVFELREFFWWINYCFTKCRGLCGYFAFQNNNKQWCLLRHWRLPNQEHLTNKQPHAQPNGLLIVLDEVQASGLFKTIPNVTFCPQVMLLCVDTGIICFSFSQFPPQDMIREAQRGKRRIFPSW